MEMVSGVLYWDMTYVAEALASSSGSRHGRGCMAIRRVGLNSKEGSYPR